MVSFDNEYSLHKILSAITLLRDYLDFMFVFISAIQTIKTTGLFRNGFKVGWDIRGSVVILFGTHSAVL
jgi:hypothetical protein